MNYKNQLLIIIIFIFCVSCTKNIDVDLPVYQTVPVINSFFCPDDIIKVQITESSSPYVGLPKIIENAFATLYENDILVDTLIFENGFYISDINAKEEFSYMLKTEFDDYEATQGVDIVPQKPIIISVTFQDSVLIDDDGFYLSKAEIIIDDVGDGNKFYEISLSARYFKDWGLGGIEECIEGLIFSQSKNTDPVLLESGLLPYEYSCLLFSNDLFAGERYALQVYYLDWYPDYDDYDLIISVKSVSENYYNYQKIIKLYNYSSGTIFNSGDTEIGDPVSLFSNVENGYGIFAAYSFISDTIPKY